MMREGALVSIRCFGCEYRHIPTRFGKADGTRIRMAAPRVMLPLEVLACASESVFERTCDGFEEMGLPTLVVGMIGESPVSEMLQRADGSHRAQVVATRDRQVRA
jgi:hypothetical protein